MRPLEQKLAASERAFRAANERCGRPAPLNVFWSVIVYDHEEELPFVAYPAARFRHRRLLPFTGSGGDARPEPNAAEIFQSYLRGWLEARA